MPERPKPLTADEERDFREDVANVGMGVKVHRLFATLDAARARIATLQAAPEINGDAIMEARAYLKEHLGVEATFFDDCIHNAVALCLQARGRAEAAETALAEARAEIEKLRGIIAFVESGGGDERDPNDSPRNPLLRPRGGPANG